MSIAADQNSAALVRSRIAVTVIFLLFGLNIGMWAAHIPVVQARLALDTATIGLTLLGAAAGSMIIQPTLGAIMGRVGSRIPAIVFPLLAAALTPVMVLAPSLPLLIAAVFVSGLLWGGMNIAMNTQASEIEKRRGKPTMSSFHAAASLGMLGGATLGGVLLGAGFPNGEGSLGVAAVALVAAGLTIPFLVHDNPATRGPAFVMPSRAVIGLGILAFLMFVIEGGMGDWSALFLARDKGAPAAWAAAGFALFTAAMAAMRVVGDGIVARLGRQRTVTFGASLVVVGILIAVLSPWAVVSTLTFGLVGIGAANIVPIIISTAAQIPGVPPSVSVGAVATLMTIGFLVGPPVIGFVAHFSNLSVGVSLMALAGVIVAIVASLRTWQAAPSPNG